MAVGRCGWIAPLCSAGIDDAHKLLHTVSEVGLQKLLLSAPAGPAVKPVPRFADVRALRLVFEGLEAGAGLPPPLVDDCAGAAIHR